MTIAELEEKLTELKETLEEIEEERMYVLSQTGYHLPGGKVKQYEAEVEETKRRILALEEILRRKFGKQLIKEKCRKMHPLFLATGIGSLPHKEPDEAIKLIKNSFPEIPHWFQLPSQSTDEGLVTQFISPLIKLGLVKKESGRTPFIDTLQHDWLDKITDFYNLYLEILDGNNNTPELFAFPRESAKGFYAFLTELAGGGFKEAKYIKGQVTGPITLGLQLPDQDRKASYYDKQLRDIVVKNVALQAYWQAKILGKYDIPVIIFIDEPGLYAYGQSTHITLNNEEIKQELNEVIKSIHQAGAKAGIHICASTDWKIILETDVDILNFDAFEYFTSLSVYPDSLKKFYQREGILAWGIVPTSEHALRLTFADLVQMFEKQIDMLVRKGLDRETLLKQAMITPTCGVGSVSKEVAEKVYNLTNYLSTFLRDKYDLVYKRAGYPAPQLNS